MGTHITSNVAEEAALRYTPNNWDLAGSLTGIYGVVKKAGEHLATVSRWLGEKSVVQEKMSALGLGASALGFGLMAKTGLEALERKLGLMGSKEGDPTSFQDTNTLIQTLLMGVNLVRKSKQAQFWSFIAGAGLDLYDIFSNWGEAPSGQNWMRLGMFAFFNTGSHNQARLSEAAEESATYAAHLASRIKPQHLAGGLGMLASNEAWASVGGHAFSHPVLWGGGVLAGAAVAVGRRFGPEVYDDFIQRYYDALIKKFPEVVNLQIASGGLWGRERKGSITSPGQLPWQVVCEYEKRNPIFRKTLGGLHQKNPPHEKLEPHQVLLAARYLYGDNDLTTELIGQKLGISRQATGALFDGHSIPCRLSYLVGGMEDLVGLPAGTLGGVALGYCQWPSLLGDNPTPHMWLNGIGRYLRWNRILRGMSVEEVAVSISGLESGDELLLSAAKVYNVEAVFGLNKNATLAFLLRDPDLIERPGNFDPEALRGHVDQVMSQHSLKQADLVRVLTGESQHPMRQVVSRLVSGKGNPAYTLYNIALLEQSMRVAMARAMWVEQKEIQIISERDNKIASVGRLHTTTIKRQKFRANAAKRIKELDSKAMKQDSNMLITQYQDQLPPVGFLMRYAFGVGDTKPQV